MHSQKLKKWLLVLILSMFVYVYVAAAAPSPSPTTTPAYAPSPQYHEWPPADYRDAEHGIDRRIVIVIVVASSVVAIILVSISTHCFLKRRQRSLIKPPNSKHDVESFLLQHGSLAPKRYKFSEVKKITRSFGEKLGEGGYGSVYKGKLGDGRPVAVKVLAKVDSSSGEDFINEVDSISRTSHVNIVTLLGFCSQGSKRALVYEFMPNTSLDKFLNQAAAPTMDLQKLFKIALGTAKGLEYLHTGCTTRIVHFDIKPQNILLDVDFCPKISDFGLAKLCKKKQSIISISELGPRGTVGYIAPEVFIRNIGRVSHKSDVYSYGMMLLKMAQAHKVVESDQSEAEVTSQSSEDYFPDNVYAQIIRYVGFDESSLVIQDEERETITKMCVVGFWCVQTNPSTRPSISKVVEMLEGSLNSIPIPPKPMLCEPQPLPPSTFSENYSSQYD